MVYFNSDLHLGHRNIATYRQLKNSDYHDELIFDMLSIANKRDTVFLLGDIFFASPKLPEYLRLIASLPCAFKYILGNHDTLDVISQLPSNVKLMPALVSYKHCWLSHCPIHPAEFRERTLNIHGHLHSEIIQDSRYINVNPDVTNFKLVSLDEIREKEQTCSSQS